MEENKYFYFGRTKVSVTSVKDVVEKIGECVVRQQNAYICVGNVRTAVYAHNHEDYRRVVNNSFMNTPDGMPLVWIGKLSGKKDVNRACGPDIFTTMLSKGKNGYKNFFLGDTQETLNKLVVKCDEKYGCQIVGVYSPPFKKNFEEYDYDEIARIVNESGAEVVWTALGAPKQDFFDEKLSPMLDGKVIVGVGAAFRYALGEYKEPPQWMKKMALTGLYWRVKDHPWQSFKWYVKHACCISYFSCVALINRIFKTHIYE